MNYEQKYKEALGWIKKLYPSFEDSMKEDAEHYFSELKNKESEDEDKRISKEISQFLKQNNGWNHEWLTWLEKQGEKDPCIGCINDKGCVTCENGNLKEIRRKHRNY